MGEVLLKSVVVTREDFYIFVGLAWNDPDARKIKRVEYIVKK